MLFRDLCVVHGIKEANIPEEFRSENLDNIGPNAYSALVWAASKGYLPIVERLLEVPELEEYAATAYDNNVLVQAARHGHLSVVERLLQIPEVEARVAIADNLALREAAWKGHLAVVDRLLQIQKVERNAADLGNWALRYAAEYGHLAVVIRLLEVDSVRHGIMSFFNRQLFIYAIKARACLYSALQAFLAARLLTLEQDGVKIPVLLTDHNFDTMARRLITKGLFSPDVPEHEIIKILQVKFQVKALQAYAGPVFIDNPLLPFDVQQNILSFEPCPKSLHFLNIKKFRSVVGNIRVSVSHAAIPPSAPTSKVKVGQQ